MIWECENESIEPRNMDVQMLQESGQFEEVMDKIGPITTKFTRTIYKTQIQDE